MCSLGTRPQRWDIVPLAAVGFFLLLVSAILFGLGAYLYHDGRKHEVAGKASAVIGFVALLISGAAQAQAQADRNVDCTLYNRNCQGPFEPLREMLGEMLLELALVIGFAGIGYLIAKATRRKPDTPRGSYLDQLH